MVAGGAEGRAEALRRIAVCRTAQAEELDLGGLQLTTLDGELLAALCQLGWLRRLFLGLNAEAREKPQLAFINGKKNLKVCNALSALPGALGTQALKGLVNLTSLNLAGSLDRLSNHIGDAGAQALKGLVNLTSLDLARNGIGAAGAQVFKGLVNLTSLVLPYNRIGAAGAQALKGLVNLTSLDLTDNDIGDAGAEALSRAADFGVRTYAAANRALYRPRRPSPVWQGYSGATGVRSKVLQQEASETCRGA
jgi:hypothetical protein